MKSCGFGCCLVMVCKAHALLCHPFRCTEFSQSPISLRTCFPLFPDNNPHSCPQAFVYLLHVYFHFPNSKIVYPSSDYPVQPLDSFVHTDSPRTACQPFQCSFELCKGICVRSCLPFVSQFVTVCMTLLAAALLFTTITQSSA